MTLKDSEMCLHEQNSSCSTATIQSCEAQSSQNIKCYKRRFWMLILFSTLSMLCGMLFLQYVATADITICFYGVSVEAVNWTTMLIMVVYIVLVFPVAWLMTKIDLRKTVITGSLLNTASSAVQFATLTSDSFAFVMVGKLLESLSAMFIIVIPPILAAIWFPSKEVSRACSVGVCGNMMGMGLGYLFSPLMISNDCSNLHLIAEGKRNVAIILTSLNAVVLLLIIFTFQAEPQCLPSIAQAGKKNNQESFLRSALSMAKNVHFVLVFITYGLLIGAYYALATLLDNLMLRYFPSSNVAIGWMGLLLIMTGLVGSTIAGCILDYTHKFKETSISICLLSCISYIVFSCLLSTNMIWIQFVTLAAVGFFMTSYFPVGFEYGIEVTYPESEITSAGLLNSSSMIFGIIITEITSYLLQKYGPNYANAFMVILLLTSTIISCFVTKNYKRSIKDNEASSTNL